MNDEKSMEETEGSAPYTEPDADELQPGVEVECEIMTMAAGGKGLARIAGMVVFIERALPGQRVRALLLKRKKRFAEAALLEVVRHAPNEVSAPCPHFGDCGGCDWQNLDYPSQLHWKRRLTAEALQRLGGAGEVDDLVADTLPSPLEYGYRNKMEFAFGEDLGGGLALGLRHRASHDVLNLETCLLPHPGVLDILLAVRELCASSGLPPYDPETREGFWRFLVVRSMPGQIAPDAEDEGERVLIQCITTGKGAGVAVVDSIASELMERFPKIVGFVHGARTAPNQIAMVERVLAVHGEDSLQAALQDPDSGETFTYHISAGAFFQTNTDAAARLFSLVRKVARAEKNDVVWDVYCGGGGAGLWLARDAAMLVGFDGNREAVADARRNAAANDLSNCVFRSGEVRRMLQAEREAPDIVVLDPPRVGLAPEVVDELIARAPQRIVYISCNPATQARDVGRLLGSYTLAGVHPVDLFPQAHHVESVAVLERK